MFSRRPGFRFNRGRISIGGVSLVIGDWDVGDGGDGYWHADDGPIDVGGGAVHPWVPLVGSENYVQTGSADRGTLSTTTMSGGRRTVDFDGSTDYMTANGIASAYSGFGKAFLWSMHVQLVSVVDLARLTSLGLAADDASDFLLLGMTTTGPEWRLQRRGSTGSNRSATGGTPSAGEFVLTWFLDSDQLFSMWSNGTLIVDAVDFTTSLCSYDRCALGARVGATVQQHSNIGVRVDAKRTAVGMTQAEADAIHTRLYSGWYGK